MNTNSYQDECREALQEIISTGKLPLGKYTRRAENLVERLGAIATKDGYLAGYDFHVAVQGRSIDDLIP